VLCEIAFRRNGMLSMDFDDVSGDSGVGGGTGTDEEEERPETGRLGHSK
jgi:hypothetical protein